MSENITSQYQGLMEKIRLMYKDEFKEITKEARSFPWNQIYLSTKGFKGGIYLVKTTGVQKIPIFFYINECIIIEDRYGHFSAGELKEWLMDDYDEEDSRVDLSKLEEIDGLVKLAWFNEKGEIEFNEEKMTKLKINSEQNREDIKQRMLVFHRIGEEIEKNVYDVIASLDEEESETEETKNK